MTAIDQLAIAHRRMRFVRPDVWRYAKPDPRTGDAAMGDGRDADRAFELELASIRRDLAMLGFVLKEIVARKYAPDQPRVPAGQPDGGQWTDGSGRGAAARQDRVRLAGEIPTDGLPEIPPERPPTAQERNSIARGAARRLGGRIWPLIEAVSWLAEKEAEIRSSLDPPKSLEELQQSVSTPAPGYDIHHIVEKSSATRDGYTPMQIEAPDNLVRIPRWKHWEINAWYQTPNDDYGGETPRAYLDRRSWEERRAVGLKALIHFEVLRP